MLNVKLVVHHVTGRLYNVNFFTSKTLSLTEHCVALCVNVTTSSLGPHVHPPHNISQLRRANINELLTSELLRDFLDFTEPEKSFPFS